MLNQHLIKALVVLSTFGLWTAASYAQEAESDWFDSIKNMGKIYSDDESPLVQEVKLFGRAHFQWNHSDGESAGESFDGNGEELRRLRAGASVDFLNGFTALGRANLEDGGHRDTKFGYSSFDELYLSYSFGDALGLDSTSVGYGRYKVKIGGEEHESSKRIKTVERSNINNRFGGIRPTGVMVKAKNDGVTYLAGAFTTEEDKETLAGWDDGIAYYASAETEALSGTVTLDFIHADDSDNDGSIFDFEWVTSATYEGSREKLDYLANATYSDTDSGSIFGAVIMPSTYIIPEKLEAVGRYQFATSSGDASVPKSSSSRGIRRVAKNEGVETGSGDENHTFYVGLNYYLEGHNLKLMTGIEYEEITGDVDEDLDGYTFWAASRFYF